MTNPITLKRPPETTAISPSQASNRIPAKISELPAKIVAIARQIRRWPLVTTTFSLRFLSTAKCNLRMHEGNSQPVARSQFERSILGAASPQLGGKRTKPFGKTVVIP